MKCPLCETSVSETDVACRNCDEMLSDWRVLRGNGNVLRQRGLHLAHQGEYVGACLSFLYAALSDPTDDASLVDAGRSLILQKREGDAVRILRYAHQRSRESGADRLLNLIEEKTAEAEQPNGREDEGGDAAETAAANEAARKDSVSGEPLLGLGVLVRKKVLGSGGVDGLWESVLHTERHWQGDWRALQPWLSAACEVKVPHPALIYMQGLIAWGRGEAQEALHHFERSLKRESTVLNPSAWALYVALTSNFVTGVVVELAVDSVGQKGLKTVMEALSARIAEMDTDRSRHALRRLRNLET